ncbi:hypothetical protein BMR11_03425 [Methylococcaceae bacterium CS5]|nr:hypothetical protein BMR11_03425 [Methylococcaceae bacterium CS5]
MFSVRKVLDRPLDVKGFKLANRARKVPVVLTVDEIRALLEQMQGVYALLAGLQYGTGMRLMEVIRLRIQDIDMGYQQIVIRNGKTGAPCYLTTFWDSCHQHSFAYAANGRCPGRPASVSTTHKTLLR